MLILFEVKQRWNVKEISRKELKHTLLSVFLRIYIVLHNLRNSTQIYTAPQLRTVKNYK